jgi:hypothetical protein
MARNFAKLAGLNAIKNTFNSIRAQWGEDASYRVVADAPHSHFIEFGTVNQEAQPYMRPAVEKAAGNAKNLAVMVSGTDELTKTVANEISDEAQRIVVVDTGELRDSIHVEKGD